MISFTLTLAKGDMHCHQLGHGARLAICLHGFADDGARFIPLAEALGHIFTVVMPDLPAHGKTTWHRPDFELPDVEALIQAILLRFGHASCTIIAHSWGGRLLIPAIPRLNPLFDQIWLIAPGGFDHSSRWGGELLPAYLRNPWIDHVVLHAKAWTNIIRLASRLRLLKRGQSKFLSTALLDKRQRTQLAFIWRNLHHFSVRKTNLAHVKQAIFFVVGTKDNIISLKQIQHYVNSLPNANIALIKDAGHWPGAEALARVILEQQPASIAENVKKP
jgi:pimeloyl-ACP methyl ester carboxylesterase